MPSPVSMVKEKEEFHIDLNPMLHDVIDLKKAYDESVRDIREGQVVKGVIVGLTPKEVLVDVGYKSEGYIPLHEFPDPAALKIGDEVEVLLESREDEEGTIVLSKRKAERTQGSR